MSEPSVSVIIPAYRASATIGRALDSLLSQTRPAEEILIVDDGSPDDLASALQPYGDQVRVLRKPNGGAASARNHGIEHARGEFVAFLDADDYFLAEKIERQLKVFAGHPEVGLCATRFYVEIPGIEGRRLVEPERRIGQDRVLSAAGPEVFAVAINVWTTTVMVRRRLLEAHRFDTGLRTAEDIDLWIRLAQLCPVFLLSERLSVEVQVPGSLSRSDVAGDSRNMLQVVRRHAHLLGGREQRREEARVYRDWAGVLLAQGEGHAALAPAWQRLVRQPWSPQAWWILCKSAAWSCAPWRSRREYPSKRGPSDSRSQRDRAQQERSAVR